MRAVAAGALALLLAAPLASHAAENLSALVAGIGRASKPVPKGEVKVSAWVERDQSGSELVVRVEPHGAAKLVAEPGVTVSPIAREGVTWPAGMAASDGGGRDYFDAPVELRLPFASGDTAGPVEANVEYAYCFVDYQCLFGETRVSALPPACVAQTGVGVAAC